METAVDMYKEALSQLAPIKNRLRLNQSFLKSKICFKKLKKTLLLQKAEEEMSKGMESEGEEELDDEWNKFIEGLYVSNKKTLLIIFSFYHDDFAILIRVCSC